MRMREHAAALHLLLLLFQTLRRDRARGKDLPTATTTTTTTTTTASDDGDEIECLSGMPALSLQQRQSRAVDANFIQQLGLEYWRAALELVKNMRSDTNPQSKLLYYELFQMLLRFCLTEVEANEACFFAALWEHVPPHVSALELTSTLLELMHKKHAVASSKPEGYGLSPLKGGNSNAINTTTTTASTTMPFSAAGYGANATNSVFPFSAGDSDNGGVSVFCSSPAHIPCVYFKKELLSFLADKNGRKEQKG
jgi:hypothetical protein